MRKPARWKKKSDFWYNLDGMISHSIKTKTFIITILILAVFSPLKTSAEWYWSEYYDYNIDYASLDEEDCAQLSKAIKMTTRALVAITASCSAPDLSYLDDSIGINLVNNATKEGAKIWFHRSAEDVQERLKRDTDFWLVNDPTVSAEQKVYWQAADVKIGDGGKWIFNDNTSEPYEGAHAYGHARHLLFTLGRCFINFEGVSTYWGQDQGPAPLENKITEFAQQLIPELRNVCQSEGTTTAPVLPVENAPELSSSPFGYEGCVNNCNIDGKLLKDYCDKRDTPESKSSCDRDLEYANQSCLQWCSVNYKGSRPEVSIQSSDGGGGQLSFNFPTAWQRSISQITQGHEEEFRQKSFEEKVKFVDEYFAKNKVEIDFKPPNGEQVKVDGANVPTLEAPPVAVADSAPEVEALVEKAPTNQDFPEPEKAPQNWGEATVVRMTGGADMQLADGSFQTVEVGMKIPLGAKLFSSYASEVTLEFPNNLVILILALEELDISNPLDYIRNTPRIKLGTGDVRFKVNQGDFRTDMEVSTPNSTASPTGTDFAVSYNKETGIAIWEIYDHSIEVRSNITGEIKTISSSYGQPIKRIEVAMNGAMTEQIAIPKDEWQARKAQTASQSQPEDNHSNGLPLVFLLIVLGGGVFMLHKTGKLQPMFQKVSALVRKDNSPPL